MTETKYVYESPDGGHTVYRRRSGDLPANRELHSITEEKRKWDDQVAKEMQWNRIIHDSDKDLVLKEMLDKVLVYHSLKNTP
jgi:hypothetical protein